MAIYLRKVTDDFIRQLAHEYLCNGVTLKILADRYNSSPNTISDVLFKGVAENVIETYTATLIMDKAVASTDNKVETRQRWNRAFRLRERNNLLKQRSYFLQQESELESKLATYEEYFFEDEDIPSKAQLENNLKDVIVSLKEIDTLIQTEGY